MEEDEKEEVEEDGIMMLACQRSRSSESRMRMEAVIQREGFYNNFWSSPAATNKNPGRWMRTGATGKRGLKGLGFLGLWLLFKNAHQPPPAPALFAIMYVCHCDSIKTLAEAEKETKNTGQRRRCNFMFS